MTQSTSVVIVCNTISVIYGECIMELEGYREVVLLKDALIMAKNQNMRFDDEKISLDCALVVREVSFDVEDMMSVDFAVASEKERAQRTMHLLLLCKTMMTSNDMDEDQFENYAHICSTLPNIGWKTYVTIIQVCHWLEFAAESWNNQPFSMHISILQNILRCVDNAKTICIWEKAIRQLIDCLILNDITPKLDIMDVLSGTRVMVQNVVETESDETKHTVLTYMLEILRHCSMQEQRRHCVIQGSNFYEVFRDLMFCTEQMLCSISEDQVKSRLTSSPRDYDVIFQLPEMQLLMETGSLPELQKILGQNSTKYNNEDLIKVDLLMLLSRKGQFSDALERLLTEFETSADSTILGCFLHNVELLESCHVNKLMSKVGKCKEREDAIQLQQVIFEAFSQWSLEEQDVFRERCHQFHGFRDDVFIDIGDPSQQVVQTINKLSTVDKNECMVAKEISLLCLKWPVKMLTKLFDHAVLSGQADTVMKILTHLRRSCCFTNGNESTISVANSWIAQILTDEAIRPLQFDNLLKFIEALIKGNALQSSELLSSCILPLLSPSPTVGRRLQMLQVIISCFDEKQMDIFCTIQPSVLLFKIGKLLHHCMTVQLDLDNFVIIKEAALATNRMILNLIVKNPGYVTGHEICWLWKQYEKLDEAILCYLNELLDSHGLLHLYTEKVKQLPLTTLLIFCCVAPDGTDAAMIRLHKDIDKVGWSKACYPLKTAISKILPRMIATEIHVLLENIYTLTAKCNILSSSTLSATIVSVAVLMDSLVILSNDNQLIISKTHLEQVSQICISSIKNFLMSHQPLPNTALTQLIFILCSTSLTLPDTLQRVIEVLLLDLSAQIRFNTKDENYLQLTQLVCRAVDKIKDANLASRVMKLFENF